MAVESDSVSQRLAHVTEPEVDVFSRQAHGREDQVGTERHRLHRNKIKSGCLSVPLHSYQRCIYSLTCWLWLLY